MIKLDLKKPTDDGSIFYRFLLNDNVTIWFTLYDNKHIYSIGITTDKLFPISNTRLFANTDNNEPYYFKKIIIETHSLNCDIKATKEYIDELQLACAIGQEIENFFKNEFLQKYTV